MNYRLTDNIGYIIQIMGTAWNIKMYYFKNKIKKEKERRSMFLNKEYIWLREKEFFKSFAKQTDALSLFWISGLNELKNLGPWSRIEENLICEWLMTIFSTYWCLLNLHAFCYNKFRCLPFALVSFTTRRFFGFNLPNFSNVHQSFFLVRDL